jgi:signal peptidase I
MEPVDRESNSRETPEPPVNRRRSLATVALLLAGAVAIEQSYLFSVRWLSTDELYLGLVGVQGALLGFCLLGARLEGRRLRDYGFLFAEPWTATVGFASLLLFVYIALRIDPGFFFGFGKLLPLPVLDFGFFLFVAPLMALAEVAFFFGFAFRTLSRQLPLGPAIFLSAGAFAVFSTNLAVLPLLGVTSATQFLFETTILDFVLGILLAFYVYKARWSLLGPLVLLSGLYATIDLLPVGTIWPSWEVDLAASLLAYAVLLLLVGLGLKEPRLQAQHYLGQRVGPRRLRFRHRIGEREPLRGTLVTVAAVGVVAITFSYGLPTILGTPSPMLAIASGSMVPTFHRGDLVVIHHVGAAAITVGTIIAFRVSCLPAPTVHRVVRVVSSGPDWVYQTKGDANPVQDPCTVPYSDVLGAVTVTVPFVGFLVLEPLFAVSLLVLAALGAFLWKGERT